jgi:two-component system NtrC family sensor kinase
MILNIFTWPPLIAAVLNLSLGLYAFRRNTQNNIVQTFAAWNLVMAVWNTATFILFTETDSVKAFHHTQWARDVLVFLPTVFLHFVLCLTGRGTRLNRRLLAVAYAASVVFMVSNNIDGLFVRELRHSYWGYYPVAGSIGIFYPIVFHLVVIYALVLLYRVASEATGFRKNQYRFVFMATLLFFIASISNFLDVLGWSIYPFGSLINIVSSLLIAYAIETYGLMNLQRVFRRGFVYATLAGAMSACYVLIMAIFKRILLAHDQNTLSYTYNVAAVPITLALAPRIRSALETTAANTPFLKTYDYSKTFASFKSKILTLLNLQELSQCLVNESDRIFDVEQAALYLTATTTKTLTLAAWTGIEPPRTLAASVFLDSRSLSCNFFIRDRVLWQSEYESHTGVPPEMLAFARTSPFALLAPFRVQDNLIGVLCLGNKRSGDIFNADDLHLIGSLSDLMTIALHNARAVQIIDDQKRQMEHQREMVVIGTMATEMAHELTKPLTHIMNAGARLETSVKGLPKENLRTIEREAQRAAEILDGFAMLSPERTLHRISVSLPSLIEEAEHALGIQENKRLRILHHYDALPNIFVNPGQVVQVLTNVIQNAWEAMPEKGTLTITLRGVSVEDRLSSVIVTIIDTGHGIAADIQGKVFQPFFTTKGSKGGRGVGLSISRAMIQRHGGTIQLESPIQDGGGTRVTITLPIIQNQETSS